MDRTNLEAYRNPMKIPVALEAVKPVRRSSEALDVLQIQQPLMAFLVKICLELLPDIEISLERITALLQATEDLEPLAAFSQAPEQPESPRIWATKEDGWDSAFALAQEIPYLLPHVSDFEKVGSSILARVHECEDHAWAMRKDPYHFGNAVSEWCKWDAL